MFINFADVALQSAHQGQVELSNLMTCYLSCKQVTH